MRAVAVCPATTWTESHPIRRSIVPPKAPPSAKPRRKRSGQVTEVYYDRICIKGAGYANTVLESIYASPITVPSGISREIIKDAGRFKTSYPMSFADAFAAAAAKSLGALPVTKDSEMKEAEEAGEYAVLWLK